MKRKKKQHDQPGLSFVRLDKEALMSGSLVDVMRDIAKGVSEDKGEREDDDLVIEEGPNPAAP